MRIGFEFEKKGAIKYISHLDLQRAFLRAIRRSGLPVRLTGGFNPHYVVSFASALALGIESSCECVEMETSADVSPGAFLDRINRVLPPGLCAKRAVQIADNAPKLAAAMREAEYEMGFESIYQNDIANAVYDIMASKEIITKKVSKGAEKDINIRNMIISIDIHNGYLQMRLAAAPSGSLRPEIVAGELQKRAGCFKYNIIRSGLFTHSDGETVPLLSAFKE
ncbi:MAG: TIGR03936 family radical SAM-associated protein [Christensenellales bacterium]|jgi:radical SAM-linked protein